MSWNRPVTAITLALTCLLTVGTAHAEEEAATAVTMLSGAAAGRERFVDACAFCHGLSGDGNGMAASMMDVTPANLTQLSKNNDGKFPLAHVYDVIDGRASTASHGNREMPVWGDVWRRNVPEQYAEYYVRGRILELILYLDTIQE